MKGDRGITTYINQLLLPAFSAGRWRLRACAASARGGVHREISVSGPDGLQGGRIVDKEVERWLKACANAGGILVPFTGKDKRSKIVAEWVRALNWEVVGAQVRVRDEHTGLNGRLDGVFKRPDGQIVVVELKTTKHDAATYCHEVGKMKGPAKTLGYSERNTALFQAFLGAKLYSMNNNLDSAAVDGELWVVGPTPRRYPVPGSMRSMWPAVRIHARRAKLRKKRRS